MPRPVSTGQFAQVLEKEVPIIKDVISRGSEEKTAFKSRLWSRTSIIILGQRHDLTTKLRSTLEQTLAEAKRHGSLPGRIVGTYSWVNSTKLKPEDIDSIKSASPAYLQRYHSTRVEWWHRRLAKMYKEAIDRRLGMARHPKGCCSLL